MIEALKTQIGGDHYAKMPIQPAEFILANNIGVYESKAIEYIVRWKNKGGVTSLQKAIHALQIVIDHEQSKENAPESEAHKQIMADARIAQKEAETKRALKHAE